MSRLLSILALLPVASWKIICDMPEIQGYKTISSLCYDGGEEEWAEGGLFKVRFKIGAWVFVFSRDHGNILVDLDSISSRIILYSFSF